MNYQSYFEYMNQLMAYGMYTAPIETTAMVLMPPFYKIQNNDPVPLRASSPVEMNSQDDVDARTLFCANLNENVSEELLYEVFLQAGPIEKVYIPKANDGKRRSYGFVTYKHRSSTPFAMRLYQGLVLFDKRLDIKFQGKYKIYNGYI